MTRKFWNWAQGENARELRLEGVIAEETWWGDEITPKLFREELNAGSGELTVWINSYGGDVFAASQIYTMLMEYSGAVTVKIDGIAASAASVIAMAGTTVEMAPTSILMIHDPSTVAIGNSAEMRAAIKMLDEIKESIISAYELKTGLPREQLGRMMASETWMNARKAVELGFADKILYTSDATDTGDGLIYSRMAVTNSLLDKIRQRSGVSCLDVAQLHKRLNLINH